MHKRRTERKELKRKLDAGVRIDMSAPRRIGKTWTLNALAEDLKKEKWLVVTLDVQGVDSPSSFAKRLCRAIEEKQSSKDKILSHLGQRLKNLIGGDWSGWPLDALGSIDPEEFVQELIAALEKGEQQACILIDEFSYFFLNCAKNDPKEAYRFAYKLRGIQQKFSNVGWMVTGSIGIDVVAERYELGGAFVDYQRYELEPYTKQEARSFLRDKEVQKTLRKPFDAGDADFDVMLDELGWLSPYYLKMVADNTRPSEKDPETGKAVAVAEDFAAAFECLLKPGRKTEFSVWRAHIKKNLDKDNQRRAFAMLDELCADQNGMLLDALVGHVQKQQGASSVGQVKNVADVLVREALLIKDGERYRFWSGLVRRHWYEHEKGQARIGENR